MAKSPHDLSELSRLDRSKRRDMSVGDALGETMADLFHGPIAKQEKKFGKLAEAWCTTVPARYHERCSLESFHRGKLVVLVDSAPHLFELKQLLLAGLEKQLMVACKAAGLTRITLRRGTTVD